MNILYFLPAIVFFILQFVFIILSTKIRLLICSETNSDMTDRLKDILNSESASNEVRVLVAKYKKHRRIFISFSILSVISFFIGAGLWFITPNKYYDGVDDQRSQTSENFNKIELLLIQLSEASQNKNDSAFCVLYNKISEYGADLFYYMIATRNDYDKHDLFFNPLQEYYATSNNVILHGDAYTGRLYFLYNYYLNNKESFTFFPLLYSGNDCYYDSINGSYKYSNINVMLSNVDKEMIVWEAFYKWAKKHKGKSIQELRNTENPMPENIYWYGESRGPVDLNAYKRMCDTCTNGLKCLDSINNN